MAIKPNECTIRIEDLVVGKKRTYFQDGNVYEIPIYAKYWENFNKHVDDIAKGVKTLNWRINRRDVIFKEELEKFGATYKHTKKWEDRYIKFKSHKHFTMFVLRWS